MNNRPKRGRKSKPSTSSDKRTVYDQAAGGVTEADIDPAQERGERIETGKSIARGGKSNGNVEGAKPSR